MAVLLQDQNVNHNLIAEFFQSDLGVQCIATKTNKWREFFSKDLKAEWQQASGRSNVYWTPNAFKTHQRGLASIVQLNAFYVDLDCYKVGMTKEMALHALNMVLDDNNLFQPTLIIDSGNGLQLVWKIKGVPVRAVSVIKLWNRIEKEICSRLTILGADSASTDASRVLRVPNTYNTKNETEKLTQLIEFNSNAVYEMRDFQFELLPEIKKIEGDSKKTSKKGKLTHLFNAFTLNKARLNDLETLLELRGHDVTNMRNIILFLLANFIENGELDIDKEKYLANANSALKTSLNSRELAIIIRNTDGKYNYKNTTLIELLQITADEQKHMKSIISADEYNRRQRVAFNKRYKPVKEANKSKKEARDMEVKDLCKQGYTQQEIARKIGIGQATVSRILKQ